MKRAILILSLAAGLMGVSFSAQADLDGFLRNVNIQAQADMDNFTLKLSKQFGVAEADVRLIIRASAKPEDAFMILQLGQMARVSPEVVLQKYQRSKGKGWGNLARELGIKPGSAEFHALKNGNLSFTGERVRGESERGDDMPGEGGPGRGHGNGKGRGHGRN